MVRPQLPTQNALCKYRRGRLAYLLDILHCLEFSKIVFLCFTVRMNLLGHRSFISRKTIKVVVQAGVLVRMSRRY